MESMGEYRTVEFWNGLVTQILQGVTIEDRMGW